LSGRCRFVFWVFVFVLCGSGWLLGRYFFGCVAGCVWLLACVSRRVWLWVEGFCFTCVHGAMLFCCCCGSECMLGSLWVSLVNGLGCFFVCLVVGCLGFVLLLTKSKNFVFFEEGSGQGFRHEGNNRRYRIFYSGSYARLR
jgi:hypothetical protein